MPAAPATVESRIRRVADVDEDILDSLAVEEPLEIRLGFETDGGRTQRPISITMRTPGSDNELAAGFLFSEGIITRADQITGIRHWPESIERQNTMLVELAAGAEVDLDKLQRHFYTTSSCGVCGKTSIEALTTNAPRVRSDLVISPETINALPDKLRASQRLFDSTGGLHASALFDADGNLGILREDVGRHNALDKVIGSKLLAGDLPVADRVLLVSGRASFELVQKALMAGIPLLAAVGAPSSLAVDLAREFGMTLLGFVRGGSFNIYAGQERVQ